MEREELKEKLEDKIHWWMGRDDGAIEGEDYNIISKKIDYKNQCGHFLCESDGDFIILYVWYSVFGNEVQLSQDGKGYAERDLSQFAKSIFDSALHRSY